MVNVKMGADRSAYPQSVLDLAVDDPQLQALMPDHLPALDPAAQAPQETVMEAVMQLYSERPALGMRAYEVAADPVTGLSRRVLLPHFSTISYGALNGRIKRLALTWRQHPIHRVAPGDFVCILGSTGIDYVTIDLACIHAQAVSVPLQTTLGGDLAGVFADTAPVTVATTIDDLVIAAEIAAAQASVRSVIVFDYDETIDSEREQFEAARAILANRNTAAELVTLDALLDHAAAETWAPLPPAPEGRERVTLLVHSSGSTGRPKGVIYTERLARTIWGGNSQVPVVRVVYAPMNHMMGRSTVFSTLARGGTAYFTARPDLSGLFEDIRLVRPTEMGMLPRLLEVIYRHFLGEVARRSGDGGDIEAQVMAEMRAGFLGDRLCLLSMGGAPTTAEIRRFILDCFQVPLNDGYGLTEAGGILANGRILRPPIIDYKLRDVPALGYFASDKPYPRGELLVKTVTATPGYFGQPEATARLFDEDGYLQTGDIMEERAPDQLVYLERANDVLKLSQGEFVAIGSLGGLFETHCSAIYQIYAYGNSERPYILAVIVPDMEAVEARLGRKPEESALRALIRQEMKEAAAAAKLRAVEVPRDFILEHEPFSFENGLLTSVQKRKRPALKARYGKQLEELYAALERRQDEDLRALHGDQGLSVEEKIAKALEATLGIEDAAANPTDNFTELGGDSLGAVTFATLLSEIFGVEVPSNMILTPAGNLRTWARTIERALQNRGGGLPSFEQIHGEAPASLHADNLDILAFMEPGDSDRVPRDPPAGEPRCVLLTGATGYLGRFLCLEWLERMEARDGKLICLIRAADPASAMRRLSASFDTDPMLAGRFAELASRHLEILIGDVAEPDLGLDGATYERLASEVDHIVHCGALVNHVLPYEELFGPNVVGTAQIVRLALSQRQKGIDYVSSIATMSFIAPGHGRKEGAPLLRSVPLVHAHARGYALSKWAGEQLLHSTNDRFGLPVNIFRCNMMLAHRRYAGQINVPDSFTRLLYSVVMTESAPLSFYELTPDGQRQPGHYDGLPVDFVAAAIVGIGDAAPGRTVQTFHVTNHHVDDGASTDRFVDWIEEAGYRVERESDYARWLERFETKLRALPEEKRQRSILPVIRSVAAPLKVSNGEEGRIDSHDFVNAVHHLPLQHVPQIERDLISKYLADMQLLGLIPEPRSGAA